MNTTTQTWSLNLKSNDFRSFPGEIQQLVDKKDADINTWDTLVPLVPTLIVLIHPLFFVAVKATV